MTLLAVRTDTPQTELCILADDTELAHKVWESGRALASTLLKEIDELLMSVQLQVQSIEGIVYYEGPGSFTGLRIGASVVNGLAYSLGVPVAPVSGHEWMRDGRTILLAEKGQHIVLPHYGAEPNVTL